MMGASDSSHHREGEHQTPGFHGDGEREVIPGRKWHKDWRVWAVVILMLVALLAYVMPLDALYALFR
jgi:hypothetical protein